MSRKGILLVNLGTPRSPELKEVRRYLSEFLSDDRVVDLPWIVRTLLLYTYILPFRAKRSAHAYSQIWTPEGSPLLVHTQALTAALRQKLAHPTYQVEFAFTYGNPSIEKTLAAFATCDHLTVLPLFPQYASSSTGACLQRLFQTLSQQRVIPSLRVIHHFYDHPAFLQAQVKCIAPYVAHHEFVLFSYHGLPERQLTPFGCIRAECLPTCPTHLQRAC